MRDALHRFWKEYVDSTHLYRVVAAEYVPRIKTHGFEPHRNPFKSRMKEINQLFAIVLRLHKQGFIMMRWWGAPTDQVQVVATTKRDLTKNFIDFTPDAHVPYYLDLRGGALANTIYIFTEELLLKRPPLTQKEWALVRKLHVWSKKKVQQRNHVVALKGSSQYLESAKFQAFDRKSYLPSPFGSFEHFQRVVAKEGLTTYEPYLRGKARFYIRTTKPMPAKEIEIK
jgi:hypothetical protein